MISRNFIYTKVHNSQDKTPYRYECHRYHVIVAGAVEARAATALVTHEISKAILTRLSVSSPLYRRWMNKYRYLSMAMALIVENDAPATKLLQWPQLFSAEGQKRAKSWFPSATIFSITVRITADIGWMSNPIAWSEKVRLRNSFFKLAGIDDAFHTALISYNYRFSRVDAMEKRKFSTQMTTMKASSSWIAAEYFCIVLWQKEAICN